MDFVCQKRAIEHLETFASKKKHSVIIEGPSGCGKTYLATLYAKMLGIDDMQSINPKTRDVRQAINDCFYLENDILLCIENLDRSNVSCAYVLLKSMEEPDSKSYFVITCDDVTSIPETLVSRSMVVNVAPPTKSDLDTYFKYKYTDKFVEVRSNKVYGIVKSFSDIDYLASLGSEKIDYFKNLGKKSLFSDSVSSMTWKMGHFDDNSELPAELSVKYIMESNRDSVHIVKSCIECLDQLRKKNVARHLVLAKLALELKYCE